MVEAVVTSSLASADVVGIAFETTLAPADAAGIAVEASGAVRGVAFDASVVFHSSRELVEDNRLGEFAHSVYSLQARGTRQTVSWMTSFLRRKAFTTSSLTA